jgi:hypothetical protein
VSRPNVLVVDALDALAKRGVVPIVGKRGKHVKIRWVDQGRVYVLIVSRTPSDYRSRLNSRAVLRRLLRAN